MQDEESSTFLTTKQLAERWDMHPGSIERLRTKGTGPRFVRLTTGQRGAIRYRLCDVIEHERSGGGVANAQVNRPLSAVRVEPVVGRLVTDEQLDILRHALGLERGNREYRNRFVTGPGSTDYPHCEALVAAGLMSKFPGHALTGGDPVYVVTDAGKTVARSKTPNK